MKFQQRYRKLCIIISKNFFTLLQTFNNEYLGALVESEILSDTNQASRIGIRLLFHPLLHIGAITVRRQLIRILFELYQEICMEKFRNDFDSMHFSISQIPGDNGMVLWVTIGQEVFLNLAAAPLKHESFKLIGFSL